MNNLKYKNLLDIRNDSFALPLLLLFHLILTYYFFYSLLFFFLTLWSNIAKMSMTSENCNIFYKCVNKH